MKKIIIAICCTLLSSTLIAQSLLKGRVTDSLNNPIADVNIKNVSNTTLVKTDQNGSFEFKITNTERKLIFSKIGYRLQSVVLKPNVSSIDVRMYRENRMLEEIQLYRNGYQTISKERATGSYFNVDGKKLDQIILPTLIQKLDGIVPGLQFDNRTGKPELHIRGINSFSSGSTKPLIVLDNFPFEGDLDLINPNDIASVSILKDAAATSIWGARAGNGVIVINTKRAQMNGLIAVNGTVNTFVTLKPPIKYVQAMNAKDFMDVETWLFEQGYYGDNIDRTENRNMVFSPLVMMLYDLKNNKVTPQEVDNARKNWEGKDYRNDLLEHYYKQSVRQQYNFSISRSSQRDSYWMGVGYDQESGNSKSDKFSVRSNYTYNLMPRLQLSGNFAAVLSSSSSSLSPLNYPIIPEGDKTNLYPYASLIDDEGNYLAIPRKYNPIYINSLSTRGLKDWTYSPLLDVDKSQAVANTNYIQTGLTLKGNILDGLNVDLIYNLERQQNKSKSLYDEDSFYARDLINRFTEETPKGLVYNLPTGDILSEGIFQMTGHRFRSQLSLDNNISQKHAIAAILGFELSDRKEEMSASGVYGYDDNVLTIKNVNFDTQYPVFDGLSGSAFIPSFASYSSMTQRLVSVYFNGSYTWNNRYTASISARRDASNMFGVKTNDKWNPLWSYGIAWNMKAEKWLSNVSWLDALKVKMTKGLSGNLASAATQRPILTYLNNSSYTNLPYAIIQSPPNPHLKWEDVSMQNFAIEYSILQNRVNGSFDYFHKTASDLIAPDPIDPTTGYSNMVRNVGIIKSRGFESVTNIQWLKQKKTGFTSTMMLSYVKDIVKSYNGVEAPANNYMSIGGRTLTPLLDKVLYPVFSYKFEGLNPETGDPIGLLDGTKSQDYTKILNDSLKNINYHGSALPLFYGSFQNTFQFGPLSLYVNISYKFGHYFVKPTISYSALYSQWTGHADFERRWQKPGDELTTSIPSMTYPASSSRDSFYKYSSVNVERGDQIRLQSARVGYDLKKWMRSWTSGNCQVYASVNNLGLLWSRSNAGYDADYNGLPPAKSYVLGLSIQF